MEQRTPEWYSIRISKVTASRLHDVMAKGKQQEAVTRRNYRAEKVLERLSGLSQEKDYVNDAMRLGIDAEQVAREMYEFETGNKVQECGFISHQTIADFGCSPDGLSNHDGLIEIKCPEPAAYYAAAIGTTVDRKYMLQVQGQLACTQREWCDLLVYRHGLELIIERIGRDEAMIDDIEREVRAFLNEVDSDVVAFLSRHPLPLTRLTA